MGPPDACRSAAVVLSASNMGSVAASCEVNSCGAVASCASAKVGRVCPAAALGSVRGTIGYKL